MVVIDRFHCTTLPDILIPIKMISYSSDFHIHDVNVRTGTESIFMSSFKICSCWITQPVSLDLYLNNGGSPIRTVSSSSSTTQLKGSIQEETLAECDGGKFQCVIWCVLTQSDSR